MKRELSPSPPHSSDREGESEIDSTSTSDVDTKPQLAPAYKTNNKARSGPKTKTPKVKAELDDPSPQTPKKRKTGADLSRSPPSALTPEKKERIVEVVFLAGCAMINVAELARELDITPKQIQNAIGSGRKGNLRDKVLRSVGEGM